ncbi:MAG: LLM class flavin-dependent oxidoreductase [Rhodobacteraceae bacterium]|nr:LLM class flavin-dependent oxidoreductase [Paracoccaceae bacterium]
MPMEIGIFLPIAKGGFIMSRNVPPTWPTWELNRDVTLKCEALGFDFALSMVKFRGFGGDIEYWDYALDSFTLTASLAPITKTIKLIPSVTNLSLHPAVAARMAATIEAVCPGRFGLNIVSGWYKDEFLQMGLWPGDVHFESRYDYADEYVTILRDLWSTGKSNFKGKFFTMNDAEIKPVPSTFVPLVCAGQSPRGIKFTAEKGERNFVIAGGNIGDIDADIAKFKEITSNLQAAAKPLNRSVGTIALFNIIAADTDAAANKRFEHIVAGADEKAIARLVGQAELDKSEGMSASLKRKSMFMGLPTLVGSYETVAKYLDRIYDEAKIAACMFAFPDFGDDLDTFGSKILPRLESRRV